MTLLDCFECEYSAGTVPELEDHLWAAHQPETTGGETICPQYGIPVSRSTFSYHFPCLFDVSEMGLFTDSGGALCPLCGNHFQSDDGLSQHIDTHTRVEQLEYLGRTQNCSQCGEKLSPNWFENHYECLLALTISSDNAVEEGQYNCPNSSCDLSFETKGRVLWHLWLNHLNYDGLSGPCPGCGEELQFGELQPHLACIDGFSPVEATALLPEDGDKCFLCGTSVYGPVLHRHYHKNHNSSKHQCSGCGEPLTEDEGEDILNHIVCLAANDGPGHLDTVDDAWYCPECPATSRSKQKFREHLINSHTSAIAGSQQCEVCGDDIEEVASHKDCLIADGQLPASIDDSQHPIETREPIESHDQEEYFTELNEFVSLEVNAAIEEGWTRYNDKSINSLAREGQAIPELLHVGEQYHPDYEHQLVYQYPSDEDGSASGVDLKEEYGIHPGNLVVINGNTNGELPREAVVTFVEGQSIGIALRREDGAVTDRLLQSLSKDDCIYHCAKLLNPLPFERERKAINKVRENNRLRDVGLGNTSVEEQPVTLPESAVGDLNEYQKQAVERALGANDFLCIHGPPGTGKTRTLTRLIRIAVARGERVLATSHSNQAIDNLLVGSSSVTSPDEDTLHYVGSPATNERTLPHDLQSKRDDNPDSEAIQSKINELLNRPNELTISRVGNNTDNDVVQREYTNQSIRRADVVAGTMNSLAELDEDLQFDLVVIDEAGQAAQPASFIPFLRGDRAVLAGDHLQLPPYAADESAKKENMHISLFEHLLDTFGSSISVMLQKQYRMNEEIASFPSEYIYDGQLHTAEQNRDWTVDDLKPIIAADIQGEEQTREGDYSKYNPAEADIVADHVKLLRMNDVSMEDIGVITPYSAQVPEIRRTVSEKIGTTHNLKIATVDSFQGSEREAIIVSFVRSNPGQHSGFLASPEEGKRRLNVSLTRAKKRLVLIGDWNTLGTAAEYEDQDTCSNLYSELYHELNESNLIKHYDD